MLSCVRSAEELRSNYRARSFMVLYERDALLALSLEVRVALGMKSSSEMPTGPFSTAAARCNTAPAPSRVWARASSLPALSEGLSRASS